MVAATVVLVGIVLVGAWLLLRPTRDASTAGLGGLPGPRGGSSVAQDINTRVGQPAPSFTLSDSEGKRYAVQPGQGRPIVLVFHMGIT